MILIHQFSMPTARQGFVQIEAFFQMLDLHEIRLRPQDKLNLQKLCETRSSQIKYKDALALIQPNRELNAQGQPLRQGDGLWILQIPRKRGDGARKYASLPAADQRSNAPDAASVVSHMSLASEVSIDPVVRRRAEKILAANRLEVINEERQTPLDLADNKRLTAGKLKALGEGDG